MHVLFAKLGKRHAHFTRSEDTKRRSHRYACGKEEVAIHVKGAMPEWIAVRKRNGALDRVEEKDAAA